MNAMKLIEASPERLSQGIDVLLTEVFSKVNQWPPETKLHSEMESVVRILLRDGEVKAWGTTEIIQRIECANFATERLFRAHG